MSKQKRQLPVPHVKWVPEAGVYIMVVGEVQANILFQMTGMCAAMGPMSSLYHAFLGADIPQLPVGDDRKLNYVEGWEAQGRQVFLYKDKTLDAVVPLRDGTAKRIWEGVE